MGRGEEVVGPGAEGETAAASDPEDCKQAKYGCLPEQMQSLLGNRFEASWKKSENKEVKEGTNNVRPPGELLTMSRYLQKGFTHASRWHIPILLCYRSFDEVVYGYQGQSLWTSTVQKDEALPKWVKKKKGKKELENSSNFVNVHLWSTFWGWNEDPQRHLCG